MSQSTGFLRSEEETEFTLIFVGRDADESRLDLYDDSISLRGLARTLAIVGHYYMTGEIIAQAPRSKLPLYALPSAEGSFRQNVIVGAVSGIIAAPFGNFASRLIDEWIPPPNNELKAIVQLLEEQNKLLKSQPTKETPAEKKVKDFISQHKDQTDVLRSVTSYSFKDLFRPIGRSANAVVLAEGTQPRPFGAVDPPTLSRIEADEVDDSTVIVIATVNAFSRSSKTGIAFSKDLGRVFGSSTLAPSGFRKRIFFLGANTGNGRSK